MPILSCCVLFIPPLSSALLSSCSNGGVGGRPVRILTLFADGTGVCGAVVRLRLLVQPSKWVLGVMQPVLLRMESSFTVGVQIRSEYLHFGQDQLFFQCFQEIAGNSELTLGRQTLMFLTTDSEEVAQNFHSILGDRLLYVDKRIVHLGWWFCSFSRSFCSCSRFYFFSLALRWGVVSPPACSSCQRDSCIHQGKGLWITQMSFDIALPVRLHLLVVGGSEFHGWDGGRFLSAVPQPNSPLDTRILFWRRSRHSRNVSPPFFRPHRRLPSCTLIILYHSTENTFDMTSCVFVHFSVYLRVCMYMYVCM